MRPLHPDRAGVMPSMAAARAVILCCLVALMSIPFLHGTAFSMESSDPMKSSVKAERPKIGLALSGGGARGLALIGALKVIEEQGIPIDYIAGTSMGSIVAGLYAAGLSPGEIEQVMLDMDWEDLFTDHKKRSERTFRRKQDSGARFFDFELGIKDLKPVLAPGLVAGQKFALAIDIPAIYTTDRQDFDELNIPFRAVATDLETGEMVVLDSGSLVHAVRASMSIPGVFAPVHLGGRYLVDGGLVRNLPVDVVKEMGADIIIAIDVGVQIDENSAGTIRSLADVSRQSFNIFLKQTSKAVLDLANIYIPLSLEGVSPGDFGNAENIIATGEESARRFIEDLSPFSRSKMEYSRFLKRQRSHRPTRHLPAHEMISEIRIDNMTRIDDREIKRRLSVEVGQPFDRERLRADFLRLYELGIFESVDYRLIEESGETVLLILLREKFYSPDILSLGVDYIDDLNGRSDFAVLARYSRLEMNRFGGDLRADLRLGLSRGISIEWFQPLEPSRVLFISSSVEAVTRTRNIFEDDHKTAEYQARYVGVGIDAGLQMGKFAEFRFGIEHRRINTVIDVGKIDIPEEWKTRNAMKASMITDFLDDPDFPSSGGAASIRFYSAIKKFGGEEEYETLSFDGAHFVSIRELTLFGTVSGGSDLDTKIPFDEMFLFGGPHSFAGLKEGQKRGGAFASARTGFYLPVVEGKLLVGPTLYIGAYAEVGNVWDTMDDVSADDLDFGGAVFAGLKTIFGPVKIGYGRTEGGDDSFFLTAGRQFGSF
ncbi:MAG: patatin-like phospholipase family protein [Bacteroidales bacterium]|nr:patatin-like phospholipase family protein [Candidatus Latescibacterota bacterium]